MSIKYNSNDVANVTKGAASIKLQGSKMTDSKLVIRPLRDILELILI